MMWSIRKATVAVLVVLLLLPIFAIALDDVEYRPGERAAEYLFNKGIGKSWVGGDPFSSGHWTDTKKTIAVKPFTNYHFIGYLNTFNGFSIISDSGKSLQLTTGPGNYPIYAYYNGNKLIGLFMDFSSSSNFAQLNSHL